MNSMNNYNKYCCFNNSVVFKSNTVNILNHFYNRPISKKELIWQLSNLNDSQISCNQAIPNIAQSHLDRHQLAENNIPKWR